jgi:membrane protease YdiL (CAAX protease family)
VVAGLLVLANYGERSQAARIVSLLLTVSFATLWTASSAAVFGPTVALLMLVALLGSLAYLLPSVQRAVTRVLPLRPGSPVNYAALTLALLLFAFQLGTQLTVDVLTFLANSPPFTLADLLVQEIPLIIIAVLGVGFLVRRSWPETFDRLGLRPVRGTWWAYAAVAVVAFLVIGYGIDNLASWLTPQTQKRVSDASQVVFHSLNNPPAVVLLGVTAGVAEELIFRGAMLPRFGLWVTALLFAAVHTQYGITFATLEVFVIGVGLGLLRLRAGTLACIVSHAGYDIIVGLLALH